MSLLEFKAIEDSIKVLDFTGMSTGQIKNTIQGMFDVSRNRHLLQNQIDRVINQYI